MSLCADNKLQHAPAKPTDPAHSSSENTDHTTASGEKPTTALEAVTDLSFAPSLDKAPFAQKLKSYLFLMFLVLGTVLTLWFFGFTLFQTSHRAVDIPLAVPDTEGGHPDSLAEIATQVGFMTVGVSAVILVLLYITGTANVDFWSLVVEYGWWTLPAVGATVVIFAILQDRAEITTDLD